jgi:hypothetical protein
MPSEMTPDQPENVENRRERAEQSEENIDSDERRLLDIGRLHDRATALDRLADLAERNEGENQLDIAKIRVDLGLASLENPPATAAGVSSEVMKAQAEMERRDLDKKEKEYLDVPEFGTGRQAGAEAEPGGEFQEPKEGEQEEPEAVERRQASIDQWIAEGVRHMVDRFKDTTGAAKNGERAAKLLAMKVEKGAAKLAEDYVKTGNGKEDLAFVVSMRVVDVANPDDSNPDQYISEITIDGGPGIRDRFPDIFKKKEDESLDATEAKEVELAKTAGNATEEEVK